MLRGRQLSEPDSKTYVLASRLMASWMAMMPGDHGREGDRGAAVAHQQQHLLNFLRDKFTAATLYVWMRKETAALYRQIYEMGAFSASGGESVQSRTRP
jgi:hypothetical protein